MNFPRAAALLCLLTVCASADTLSSAAIANRITVAQKLIIAKHYSEAIPMLKQALQQARKLGDTRLQARALYRIGMAHYYLGERPAAIDALQHALALERAARESFEIGLTLNNIAAIEMLLGECPQSIAHFSEALKIRQKLGDQPGIAYTLSGLAGADYCMGRPQQALEADLRVLQIWRDRKDMPRQADAQNTLGLVYMALGDYQSSQNSLNTSADLARRAAKPRLEGNATYNIGLLQGKLGHYRVALASDRSALALFHKAGDPRGEAYAFEGMGKIEGKLGDSAQSLRDLDRARSMLDKLGERYELAYVWQALGDRYAASRQPAQAKGAFERALDLAEKTGNRNGETVTLAHLARLESKTGDLAGARASVNQAIALVEQSRENVLDPAHRALYLASKRSIYELKASLEMRAGRIADAFATSEAAHARTLLDEVAGGYAVRKKAYGPAGIQQLQAVLDRQTVFIEYLAGQDQSYGWVITKTRAAAFDLPPRDKLASLARTLYQALTAQNRYPEDENFAGRAARLKRARRTMQSTARRLGTLLLGKIPPQFKRPHMLIVPDGPLYLVPFSLLPQAASSEVEEPVSASVSLARISHRESHGFAPLLIVADPNTPPGAFLPIGFSAREAATIARLARPRPSEILEGKQADASAFLDGSLDRYGLIHIASHAVADMHDPARSAIVLSGGSLDARSIMNLDIRARLVTLSACDTGLGPEVNGEGLMSLGHAFLYAGAASVLSTLWPVSDEATSVFMRDFYTALFDKKMPPAAALHEAQSQMRRSVQWRDPYYWAPFILQGAWR